MCYTGTGKSWLVIQIHLENYIEICTVQSYILSRLGIQFVKKSDGPMITYTEKQDGRHCGNCRHMVHRPCLRWLAVGAL